MSLKSALYTVIFVLATGMVVTLTVFWIVYIITDYRTIRELYATIDGEGKVPAAGRWTVLSLGISFFSIVLVVLSVFFVNLLRDARFKKRQKDFVNMMTHELKLPMSSIQMFAQTLQQREAGEEERSRFLGFILNDCARMNLLLDHLLKSQQIESKGLPVSLRRIDLREFLQRFAEKWPRPLQIDLGESISAHADPVLLELAVTNLLNNAEKYGKGSVPELSLESDDRTVRIGVRDQGPPIPKKFVKKIFRKFFRVPNLQTRRQSGVGLGLYIVKYIARLHKGSVVLTQTEGEGGAPAGKRFTLVLPRRA